MTKEIYHEGWLIKSPPTKRIWRARWTKRWFTLKQGEIPEQFCLEYYTDSNCKKLKGVIDLDQCEQVDSGLQMEHRKVKFQHMFDVKTPRRTYYLAADSEEDMNAWVNCICEVCNLQDLSKPQSQNTSENRQYYNVKTEMVENQPIPSVSLPTTLNKPTANTKLTNASDQVALLPTAEPIDNNNSVYQNFDPKNRSSSYTNRETIICDTPLSQNAETSKNIRRNTNDMKEHYYNFTVIANKSSTDGLSVSNEENDTSNVHSFSERHVIGGTHATIPRKIPENLKLNNTISNDSTTYVSSPALSTSSGPYIAISECISGNPIIDRDNPMTPLNSLDPKFYDTPRSHFNIGLNLTNDQPYSPKRNNLSALTTSQQLSRSGKSSPTDSESVFTDDEEWLAANPNDSVNGDRSMRPSESSVENDPIVFTYAQRFSKLPDDEITTRKTKTHSKRTNPVSGLCLEKSESEDQNKDINSSDTENASPAIAYGPKDINSCVDESYDIPRSHQLPYMRCNNDGDGEASSALNRNSITSAKLDDGRFSNRMLSNTNLELHSATLPTRRPHCYTNAAPTKIEGNVFRYDFDEKSDAPAVDRKLKPKPQLDDGDLKLVANKTLSTTPSPNGQSNEFKPPPCVDRKLKPSTPIKLETSTLQRRTIPNEIVHFRSNSEQISRTLPRYNNSGSFSGTITSPTSTQSIQNVGNKPAGGLEYFDLDHSNPPPICNNSNTSASTSNLSANFGSNFAGSSSATNLSHRFSTVGISTPSIYGAKTIKSDLIATNSLNAGGTSASAIGEPSVVYKQVDFIKTEAFMRTRQDAEQARAKNRSKE